jgi:hypothetical protein
MNSRSRFGFGDGARLQTTTADRTTTMLDETTIIDTANQTAPGPDWAHVQADFEAGKLSVREIARRAGVSDTAVRKRAKANGWKTGLQLGLHHAADAPQTAMQTDVQTTAQTEVEPEDDEFKWSYDSPDVVLWDRPAIAVYYNPMSQIVIRERRDSEDDAFVRVDPRDVPALVRKLEELAG